MGSLRRVTLHLFSDGHSVTVLARNTENFSLREYRQVFVEINQLMTEVKSSESEDGQSRRGRDKLKRVLRELGLSSRRLQIRQDGVRAIAEGMRCIRPPSEHAGLKLDDDQWETAT